MVERMERYWEYFRFLSGRKWVSRQGFCDCSRPHLVDGPLVSTTVKSDEGPATGTNSVSGRAISGSGRVASATPGLSEWTSARMTTSDQPARD